MRLQQIRVGMQPAGAAVAVGMALALVLTSANEACANDEIAEREDGMECATCHVKPPRSKLNDRGIYYKAVGSLDGYSQLSASFGECTHCHVRKPGGRKLTRSGKRFRRFVGSMKELAEWLESLHPPFGPEVGALPSGSTGRNTVAAVARR